MKSIINIIVDSKLWVSLCATSLCLCTEIFLNTNNFFVTIFVFTSTFLAYNFHHITRVNQKFKSKINLLFLILSFLVSIICCFNFQPNSVLLVVFFAIVSFLYPKCLRNIPVLKVFLISIIWTLSTFFLIVVENNIHISQDIWILLVSRFLFVFSITIPFDIRDLDLDNKELCTIPQILGVRKALVLSQISMFISSGLFFLQNKNRTINNVEFYSIILICLIAIGLFSKCFKNKNPFFYSFYIEGISFIKFVLLLLANKLNY